MLAGGKFRKGVDNTCSRCGQSHCRMGRSQHFRVFELVAKRFAVHARDEHTQHTSVMLIQHRRIVVLCVFKRPGRHVTAAVLCA